MIFRHWLVHVDLCTVLMMTFLFYKKVRRIIKQLFFITRTELDEGFFDGTKGENGFYEISYNIPTTRGEIADFVRLIQEVERCLGKVEMYCVEEERTLTSGELEQNIDKFVDFSLESLNRFCNNKEYQNYILTLALWPYTLPKDKVADWKNCTDLADFEQTLHAI